MAFIERKQVEQIEASGRLRMVPRYKLRYRDHADEEHAETFRRLVDADRS